MTGKGGAVWAGAVRELAEWLLPGDAARDFVGSPAGLWVALGAVAAGARGRAAEELRGVLGVAGEEAGPAVAGVAAALARSSGVSAGVAVRSRVPVRAAYRSALPGIAFGELGGDARAELDAWVAEVSGGRMGGLPDALDGGADLVLVGVVALGAVWREAFDAGGTRPAPFTGADGSVAEVPTMHRRVPARWAWRVAGGTVVELPCAGERAPRVRFVLGLVGAGPDAVVPLAWADGGREPVRAGGVELALPRFGLRGRIDALAWLGSVGVTAPSRPGADFSGLSPEPLYVSKALQEAVVEVGETGVEAAAVTQVEMTRSAARPLPVERIAFDRPFGVVVLDADGELPLFVGWRAGGSPVRP
ncbi:serpin family protein [Streptomyces sp. R302]|uniref:serpin family protein n=1 Tax=unclassified Streptomyces TaxID=2593676 RepID=UPI00145E8C12|nr:MULTISPECIES: serpin family protein [unclassified Streptomyces]NML49363.1 serpin family protein [Streptomyces sp. R301]NML77690.1 serpin family protein [Streptomyces sp. R302]